MDKISSLVEQQFPAFYHEEGEQFVLFVKAYYEYLEQSGKLTDGIANLRDYRDIDTTLDEYIKYFQNDLLPSIPSDILADKRLVAKYIKYFNQTRGTLLSYKLLFRAMYGEDIEVFYPAEQILKVSGGDWRINRYIVTKYDENNYNFVGKTVVGIDSGSTALVEDVIKRVIRGRDIHQIILSNIRGTFVDREQIRLKTDTLGSGHVPFIEAGISQIEITAKGGEYEVGDIVSVISDEYGEFAKVVIVDSKDFFGTLTFFILDGGSGYRASTIANGSEISITGGDGTGGSFVIKTDDLINSIPLYLNIDYFTTKTEYSDKAPLGMYVFANVHLASPNYGFPETAIYQTDKDFHDNANAVINIANTSDIIVGDILYGSTSSANCVIKEIVDSAVGDSWFRIDGYRNFIPTEIISGTSGSVGTVTTFQSNTVGYHVINISNTATISENLELVGETSGAFGVVKTVLSGVSGNTFVIATANTSSQLSLSFDNGPMKSFSTGETIRIVNTTTQVGTIITDSGNTEIESAYTKLIDSIRFQIIQVGEIDNLSEVDGGMGFLENPSISVIDHTVSSLGIKDLILVLQSDDSEWGTANSSFTELNVDDAIIQSSTSAFGYVKGAAVYGQPITVTQFANGTYQTSVRVWQKMRQSLEGTEFAIGSTSFSARQGSFNQGYEEDTRPIENIGQATIVQIIDNGILGENSNINSSVGANGAIIQVRTIDSGFSYRNGERITLEKPDKPKASAAEGIIRLSGVANSQGYYASTRSHLDSLRGIIHDGYYYQEYSYVLNSPIHFDRYKEVIKKLCHPSGQIAFGQYTTQSEAPLDVIVDSYNTKQLQSNGTIQLANGQYSIVGTGTSFLSEFSNGDIITIQTSANDFYSMKINTIQSNTIANTVVIWTGSTIPSANAFYYSGTQ